jgi:hypothetical protein
VLDTIRPIGSVGPPAEFQVVTTPTVTLAVLRESNYSVVVVSDAFCLELAAQAQPHGQQSTAEEVKGFVHALVVTALTRACVLMGDLPLSLQI